MKKFPKPAINKAAVNSPIQITSLTSKYFLAKVG